jgi:hypothetical protein
MNHSFSRPHRYLSFLQRPKGYGLFSTVCREKAHLGLGIGTALSSSLGSCCPLGWLSLQRLGVLREANVYFLSRIHDLLTWPPWECKTVIFSAGLQS